MSEPALVRERYARRNSSNKKQLYSPLRASSYMSDQERTRALIRWTSECGITPVEQRNVLEIGCGEGSNLLLFLTLGFDPAKLVGNELLEERLSEARRRLPEACRLYSGDAADLDLPAESFDIVFQSTVFTSILDAGFQRRLAERMWLLARPGGGVLWYDFMFDNPRNHDVRGINLATLERLFPVSPTWVRRITLAPPIARLVTRIHPGLYTLFNQIPWLRTHCLCWFQKK